MFKNKKPVYSKAVKNSAYIFSYSSIPENRYFYVHTVQALGKSQKMVKNIPTLMADDFMYKTGSKLSEFCRQQLPEEREARTA